MTELHRNPSVVDPMREEELSRLLLKRSLVKFVTFDICPTESDAIPSPEILSDSVGLSDPTGSNIGLVHLGH